MFSWCLAHCSSSQSEKWFIFLSNFKMHYSSWDQNFPGLIFASAFSDHEYINERWHFAVADVAHSVISMQICQKFENTTNCTRRSFLASLPRCLYLEFTHSLHSFKFIKKKFQLKKLISILSFFFLLLLFNKLIIAAWLELERQRKLVIFYSQNRGKE